MKVDIGVIGAMEPEILDLLSTMTDRTDETVSGVTFHTGIIDGKRVVLAKCGIGKVFAAISAQTMIMKYSPSLLVNTGVGGGIASGISTGDVVVADKLCQHDMDTSAIGDPKGLVSGINMIYFESDKRAVQILKACADSIGIKATVGTVASGDKFIASYEDKKEIYDNFGASACEMEGCAIAQVAFVNSTPLAVVRAISDSADGEATMDYPTFLPIAAKNSAALTRALISKW